MTQPLSDLQLMSVKIPVSDLAASRRWYCEVFGLHTEMEWPDEDGVVRGVALGGLGAVLLGLREHPAAAAATREFGFVNIGVPGEDDLTACAEHLDRLEISHTSVINAASGRLVGFHDLDGHLLSFYAKTTDGVRDNSIYPVRLATSAATGTPAT